jgi:hypothetical protein
MGTAKEQESAEEKVEIEGVPHFKSPHQSWCGYSSLAMLLGHMGYSKLTPEVIFSEVQKMQYDAEAVDHVRRPVSDMLFVQDPDPIRHPDISHLASMAEKLTNGEVKALIVDTTMYEKMNAGRAADGKPALTPFDVLDNNIRGGRPCIVRTTGHFLVVKGLFRGPTIDGYAISDSLNAVPRFETRDSLASNWATEEPHYPIDTKYLMLVLKRPGKRPRA